MSKICTICNEDIADKPSLEIQRNMHAHQSCLMPEQIAALRKHQRSSIYGWFAILSLPTAGILLATRSYWGIWALIILALCWVPAIFNRLKRYGTGIGDGADGGGDGGGGEQPTSDSYIPALSPLN